MAGFVDGRSGYPASFEGRLAMRISPTLSSGSQQDEKDGLPDLPTPEGYIWPPLPLHGLSHLSTQNSIRRAIVEAIVRNTVGLGWSVRPAELRPELPKAKEVEVPAPPPPPTIVAAPAPGAAAAKPAPITPPPSIEEPPAEPETKTVEPTPEAIASAKAAQRAWDATRKLDRLAAKDYVADSPSFLGLCVMAKTDEEECGNGAIEVSRNKLTGEIDGLYYAPGNRVRRDYARRGYCIVPEHDEFDQERIRFFRPFGEGIELNDDGKLVGWEEGYDDERKGMNELLIFRLMTSESRDYGLPRDTSLLEDYLSDHRAAETNTAFFANGGVVPTVLFVSVEVTEQEGEVVVEVPRDVARDVANTIRPSADGHAGQVAILPLPPGGKVEKVDLGAKTDKDVGFTLYRAGVIQRQLSTFRLQPIFIATTAVGGSSQTTDAEVQRAMTQEQVFDPEQGRWERIITTRLLPHLGFDDLEIAFKKMAVEGDAARRESTERAAEVKAVTNAEFRDAHGLERLPEDGDKVPEGWNDELVSPAEKGGAPGQSTPTPKVNAAEDQRGQQPGVGGRVPRGTENPEHPRAVVAKDGAHPDHVLQIAGLTEVAVTEAHERRLAEAFPPRVR